MSISIEVPVVSGAWLIPTIESVLSQTSRDWRLFLLWDGGDDLSRKILEKIEKHPRATVFYTERMGIASARKHITDRSEGEWILPLDHDDVLHKDCVARFLDFAKERPWAGIVRARRAFVDTQGIIHTSPDWFPFERRHYFRGMTRDLFNHSQPMIIRRSAYLQTEGWDGFPEYLGAGEDCDMFAKIEEVGEIELLDEILYFYRLHDSRTSNTLGGEPVALDMWRRIADKAIARRQVPLERTSEVQPFTFRDLRTPARGVEDIDFVVPFWESNEVELEYPWRRPTENGVGGVGLSPESPLERDLAPGTWPLSRIELFCSAPEMARGVRKPLHGTLRAELHTGGRLLAAAEARYDGASPEYENVSFSFEPDPEVIVQESVRLRLLWAPAIGHDVPIAILTTHTRSAPEKPLLMRLFRAEPGASRHSLDRCLASLRAAGVPEANIHVVEERQSSAANRNTGFRRGTRPYVCYLDDDVEVTDAGCFDTLLRAMHDLDADLVAPKLLDAEGRIFCAAPYFGEEGMPRPRGIGEADRGQYDFSQIVSWLPSTCLLTRRSVGLSAGPWDTRYTGSQMEDVDYVLKARSRGFRCAYVGTAAVVHHNLQRNYRMAENLPLFKARWKRRPDLFVEPPVEEA